MIQLGKRAKAASRGLKIAPTATKNNALLAIADALCDNMEMVISANQKDIAAARSSGISEAMIDRLTLTESRIRSMADAVRQVVKLEDPVGKVETGFTRPNGLRISKTKVPLGVVAIIFESRPNVTVDAAVLCLKSGNACILRGGKEAIHSNKALAGIMRQAIAGAGISPDAILLVEDTSRESAAQLMRLNGYVDVLIPRGGAGLIKSVVENATVPVIETGAGNCFIFVDDSANFDMAASIIDNAKTSRPSVCNAVENVLVHRAIAPAFLPQMAEALAHAGVEIRGCSETCAILPSAKPATEEDFYTEYNDYILAVKVVSGIDEAISFIESHSTHHSEAIITESYAHSQQFLSQVDSAAVYVNASTRFTDGGEFGFGAEIGISTQKLHTRGPMGLSELTTTKYIIFGDGQIR
ncbi:glutamate-5-semialdehyde dehydrogenase [Phocea massiliensis]|jgi:glutamate-5-semialdehyde dehydrogenase|uniref:Gamma-glutamyl phosphate reductase n=1 Tax=uncultured Anaerotruncus sp. TaxID=905011 RepID=A0A6N2TDJ8_9FIRM|nr:glutamate-5-semialdehyde dehydrogenase [Merdimmobilis hominis]MCD4835848.1 glutamate-5-semialdehyde dehydrogenase [Merdimmobilis hominis]